MSRIQLMEFAIAHRKINGNSFWISLKKKDPTQGVESTLFQCNICLFAVVSNHQPRRESYCNFNYIVLNYAPKGPVNFFQDETPIGVRALSLSVLLMVVIKITDASFLIWIYSA
jgi:hypothetical protein